MGMDASAELCFGIALNESWFNLVPEGKEEEFDYYEEDEFLFFCFTGRKHNRDTDESLWKWEDKCPITFVGYGGEDKYHILAIRESVIRGDWDAPTEIDPEKLNHKPYWNDQLRDFLANLGKRDYSEPKWYLTADFS